MEKSYHEIDLKHALLWFPSAFVAPAWLLKMGFFLLLELAYNLISRFFQGRALNRSKMKIFQGLIWQPLRKKTHGYLWSHRLKL